MMISMETCLRQGRRKLKQWALNPRVQQGARAGAYGGSGFLLSALSPGGFSQPVVLGLISALDFRPGLLAALGAMAGFRLFWGQAGWLGILWAVGGILLGFLRQQKLREAPPLLLSALAGLWVGAVGLIFLFFQEAPDPFPVFLLRVFLSAGSAWYFPRLFSRQGYPERWIAGCLCVLALSGIRPVPAFHPGAAGVGVILLRGSFPAAAMAGLGLDMATVTRLPMTAAACLGYFLRCLPWKRRWMRLLSPVFGWAAVSLLTGIRDYSLIPGLLVGGAIGYLLPLRPESIRRQGETGAAQVRLELTAGVFSRIQQLLLETETPPVDEEALLQKARNLACANCPSREICRDRNRLRLAHLRSPRDFSCRAPGRIRSALSVCSDQLKNLNADRLRRREYRYALIQQYQFLAEYLRRLADQLPRRGERVHSYYRLEAAVRTTAREQVNGDRCFAFPGTGCRYYFLLCDGMGTGIGAAREGQSSGELLRQLLTAGFPADYACRSLNSLLLLRGQAGTVTVDLAEIRLDTGRITLYKWGAAPSYVFRRTGAEKIGTATAPPGYSMTESREMVLRLSLHRGEALILVSDGAQVGEKLSRMEFAPDAPPGELADRLLEKTAGGEDDATVAVVRLRPRQPSA